MTASNHVVTGILIGAVIANPVAIPIAFVAHFALDAIPHFGFDDHVSKAFIYYLSIDTAIAAALLLSLVILQPPQWPLLVLCGIACASPDLMWLNRWIQELRHKTPKAMGKVRQFHARIQWGEKQSLVGISIEIVWFVCMLALVVANLSVSG